ncbi:MAG: hypothetical protein PPP56_02720 [Longimonas sp.]|uniref:hypothetical protein n=1 Tax=Longimonas sp. TaxID=2039626 RepID=UPI00335678D0
MNRLLPLLLLGVLVVLGGCDTTNECGPFKSEIRTTGFSGAAFKVDPDATFEFEFDLDEIEDDTLAAGELGLRLQLEGELYAAASPEPRAVQSIQLIPAARACSPPIPEYDAMIQDIRIYSDTDFGDAYPAGENLAGLFDIAGRRNGPGMPYERQSLIDFLERTPRPVDVLLFILNDAPLAPTTMQFTVEYEQEGEGLEAYAFTTDSVVVGER